ncbi:AtpZ/AtpI family protein [Amaricoccus sp.]|uniref:AtpZ/AtpI family protein n=1 Tax=Amaricoccus sp. TaxID=1872485 RepID=UPI00261A32CF|nr:AtpZ/AtpI family protein [Amaricoccus sp.]HRO11718.1 AtpZ/AtpI family protein [Amaricoccus sp.]
MTGQGDQSGSEEEGGRTTEEPFAERLKRLEDRIAAARADRAEPPRRGHGEFTQGSLAWRMVIELVVGMLLGLAIGMGLDALFGTRPVFLVVFALLGFAAGVRTMLRTAEEVRGRRGEAALMGGRPETRDETRDGTGD